MNRFLLATIGAAALGLGTAATAHAQIVYGYSTPGYGGIATTGTVITPFGTSAFTNFYSPFTFTNQTVGANYTPYGVQGYSNYYSPFGGGYGQSYTNSLYGSGYRSYGYNPWNGFTSGTLGNGITYPTIIRPSYGVGGYNFGGNSYNYYRHR